MQPTMKIVVSMFLLTSVVGNTHHSSAKLRRDGVLNLYPFPRVGRASARTWQIPPLDDSYTDWVPRTERQLFPFPRVGRRSEMPIEHLQPDLNQPSMRQYTENMGMWFGPRIGRSFKSEQDDIMIPNDNERSDPELMEAVHEERDKRQTN